MRTPPPYRLNYTAEYSADLRQLEAGVGLLGRLLDQSIYHVLKRAPQEGFYSEASGLWIIRRWVLQPLLMVQVAYRINEAAREVDLVAIRSVNTTHL